MVSSCSCICCTLGPELPTVKSYPIKVTQYLDGAVAPLAEVAAAPLCHPIRTLHLPSVAILRQNRLPHPRPRQIIIKNLIHHQGNTLENIPPIDPLMIKGCRRGDGKIISLVPVPLRIHPVQREGHDRQHIGRDCGPGPGGIDLAGGHILNIIPVRHIVVLGRAVRGSPVVDHHGLGYHYPAEHDFPALRHGLDLRLRDLWRVISI